MKGLVLFHGAGGDRNHRLFLALERALPIPVARCNFAYRDKDPGRRPPDRMPKLIESVRQHCERLAKEWGIEQDEMVLGGRSLGGRACSIAVANGLPAAGLILLSYPLHPAKKPQELRVEHFPKLDLPVLLVQGSSDPLGKEPEFAQYLPMIPGEVNQVWLERTGHDPVGKHDPTVVAAVADWLGR